MKYTYEEAKNYEGKVVAITRLEDMASIPIDPANSDYQRYLNPEAEQSTPIVINEAETI
jgi:hypothetical protein